MTKSIAAFSVVASLFLAPVAAHGAITPQVCAPNVDGCVSPCPPDVDLCVLIPVDPPPTCVIHHGLKRGTFQICHPTQPPRNHD